MFSAMFWPPSCLPIPWPSVAERGTFPAAAPRLCCSAPDTSALPKTLSSSHPEAFVWHGGVLVQPLWLQICLLQRLNQCRLAAAVEGRVVVVKHALLTPNCLPHVTQPKPVFLYSVAVSVKNPWKDPGAQQGADSEESESRRSLCVLAG